MKKRKLPLVLTALLLVLASAALLSFSACGKTAAAPSF